MYRFPIEEKKKISGISHFYHRVSSVKFGNYIITILGRKIIENYCKN